MSGCATQADPVANRVAEVPVEKFYVCIKYRDDPVNLAGNNFEYVA